ncbi:EamA family transporter [Demequina soli]|uniref:EamA family transporter n=1 Tax=Demequina soli TaxID=1638987 RepID=UPI000780633B|nr:EamA family transporter [Demequina soli]
MSKTVPAHRAALGSTAVGVLAMLVALTAWSGFALSLRGASRSSLELADIAAIRFAVPALALAWRVPRTLRALRLENRGALAALCVGAGAPYVAIVAAGGALTSATFVGLMTPGTVPLAVAGLRAMSRRGTATRTQGLGLVLIGSGATAYAVRSDLPAEGIVLLALAAVLWGAYTLAVHETTLDPLDVTVLVAVPSAVAVAVVAMTGAMPSALLAGTAQAVDVVAFVVVQGLLVGVLSSVAYAAAARRLGAAAAAGFGTLSPAITALMATRAGEPLAGVTAVALVMVVAGSATPLVAKSASRLRKRHRGDVKLVAG